MNPDYTKENPIIQENRTILDEIINSSKTCFYDHTLLLSPEGLSIASFLRRMLGSRIREEQKTGGLYHLPGLKEKLNQRKQMLEGELQKLKDSPEYKQQPSPEKLVRKVTRLESDLQRVERALESELSTNPLPENLAQKRNSLILLTADINLAEHIGKRSGENCIYFFWKNKMLRNWRDLRAEKIEVTRNSLEELLPDTPCWITSSTLASARLSRFTDALLKLPESMHRAVKLLDISAGEAEKKSRGAADTIQKLSSCCGIQPLGEALVTNREDELLALIISHTKKGQTLVTVWNDKNQAERVRQLVVKAGAEAHLRRVAFCQFNWFGKLERLSEFPDNPMACTLCGTSADTEEPREYSNPAFDVFEKALGISRVERITALNGWEKQKGKSPHAELSNETFRYLCEEKFPDKMVKFTPDEQTIRTSGTVLGKQISRLSLEELKDCVGNDPARQALAIIYARRWNMPHILEHFLSESVILSPYCFENWFKRSQNAQQHITLEELMLNNTYYDFLRQVITKTPFVDESGDSVKKLRLLQSSATISEVRKRADHILNMLKGKERQLSVS